jgi:hypothetical protein
LMTPSVMGRGAPLKLMPARIPKYQKLKRLVSLFWPSAGWANQLPRKTNNRSTVFVEAMPGLRKKRLKGKNFRSTESLLFSPPGLPSGTCVIKRTLLCAGIPQPTNNE